MLLTSMSGQLLPRTEAVAGTMGLLPGVREEEEPGEAASLLTTAGAEERHSDGDRTTGE